MSPEVAADLAVLKREVELLRAQIVSLEDRLWRMALAGVGGGAVGGLGLGAALVQIVGGMLAP